ncbi:MAG: PEGA domain-containing protein [Vicinamibacterales bacterium]
MIPRVRATSLILAAVVCAALVTLFPADASAQRRGRPGWGRGAVVVAAPVFYGYGYHDPFWWGPGWGPGWGHPGWFGPWGTPFGAFGSARLQVTPRQAEVYVDGYLAGLVDDFDGVFQRLQVPPGEHELTIYLEGYRTFTQKLLFRPGATIDIKQPLVPLAPGESTGPRPQATAPPAGSPAGVPPPYGGPPPIGPDRAAAFGTLAIRVQPAEATLLVDGEEWSAPGGGERLLIELAEGTHDIEVRLDGAAPYRRTVEVRAGRTTTLNVSVPR